MAVTNDFNRVKPGHLNIGRALRALSTRTEQSRKLTLSIPTVYEKDAYGIPTSTVEMPAIEVPGLSALISPITTKDFTMAKEGRYIGGAAKIYMPSMDSIFRKLYPNSTNAAFPNYLAETTTRPITSTSYPMTDYFRSIDGLMNAVLYDTEATIYNIQPHTANRGTNMWSATTDYSSLLGAHWQPFTDGTRTLTTDYDSITFTTSGSAGYGTFYLYDSSRANQFNLADRVSFEVKGKDMDNGFTFLYCWTPDAVEYPYIAYGSSGATSNSNDLELHLSDEVWYKVDLPFTSGSLTTSPTHYTNYTTVNDYTGEGSQFGNAINIVLNPTVGSLTGPNFPWTGGSTTDYFFGFRVRRRENVEGSISIRNIKFYRTIPWSVHSVKEYNSDYMVLNCIRTDGDSMQRQEAYMEQAPEL